VPLVVEEVDVGVHAAAADIGAQPADETGAMVLAPTMAMTSVLPPRRTPGCQRLLVRRERWIVAAGWLLAAAGAGAEAERQRLRHDCRRRAARVRVRGLLRRRFGIASSLVRAMDRPP
jgi:hypothetical protein